MQLISRTFLEIDFKGIFLMIRPNFRCFFVFGLIFRLFPFKLGFLTTFILKYMSSAFYKKLMTSSIAC